MFNIRDSVQTLRDAGDISSSKTLTPSEKHTLLSALMETIVDGFQGCPTHATIAKSVITRMREDIGRDRAPAKAPEQGRKAEGVKDTPSVAKGRP